MDGHDSGVWLETKSWWRSGCVRWRNYLLFIFLFVWISFFLLFIYLFVYLLVYFEGGEGAFFQGGNVERVFYSVWLGGQQRPFFISMLRRFHH